MNVEQKFLAIRDGSLTAEANMQQCLAAIERNNADINAVLFLNPNALEEARRVDEKIRSGTFGKLAGLVIGVKSVINVKGFPVSCASRTLEEYEGTYDADVIRKIKEEDGVIIGMLNCDEFAAGATGEHSAFGPTQNPAAPGYIAGGSSAGSAAAIAAKYCDLTLGTDTGGSIRIPAGHCGVVGVKPSYGRVSRYGMVDLSMSLDQIGPLSSDVFGAALMMEIISGHSVYDAKTYQKPVLHYTEFEKPKKLRIGVAKQFANLCKDDRITELIQRRIRETANALQAEIVEIDLKHLELAIPTYYPLVFVEFYSGTRKFDGRRYGRPIEESCGEEVLRRILGGREISRAEFEGKHYRKALQARSLIKHSFEQAFKQCDVLLAPCSPTLPKKLGEKLDDPRIEYAMDAFVNCANLAGNCAISVPAGTIENIPIGFQIFADAFEEATMLNVARVCEETFK